MVTSVSGEYKWKWSVVRSRSWIFVGIYRNSGSEASAGLWSWIGRLYRRLEAVQTPAELRRTLRPRAELQLRLLRAFLRLTRW